MSQATVLIPFLLANRLIASETAAPVVLKAQRPSGPSPAWFAAPHEAGEVEWVVGLVLGLGNMLGARVAARAAIEKGTSFLRWFLIAVVLVSGIAFLAGV